MVADIIVFVLVLSVLFGLARLLWVELAEPPGRPEVRRLRDLEAGRDIKRQKVA